MNKVNELLGLSKREDVPSFGIGDSVNVVVRIVEGEKEKTQDFKGTIIARKGSGANETFKVRKVSFGEGVERTFYLNSPNVKEIKVVRRGKVRKAKLYYLRDKIGKKAKVKEQKEAE